MENNIRGYEVGSMLVRKIFKIVRRKLTQEKYKKISANEHNSLENVDNLNKDKEYWVNVRLSDKKFIENIFDFITHSAQIKDG
ncbi:hypothetical protein, partial [Halomonas lysinitropha]|uniref:hypothetical protein n=1 Tax=Halomonas lysinitropha TaxID=2607506 RepID=UPI001CED9095